MNFALNAEGEIQPTGESVEDIAKKMSLAKPAKIEKKKDVDEMLPSTEKKTPTKKEPKPEQPQSPKEKVGTKVGTKKAKSPSDSPKDSKKVDTIPGKETGPSPPKEISKSKKDQTGTPVKEGSPIKTKKITVSTGKKKHTRPKSMDFVLKDENDEKKVKRPKSEKN